MLMSMEQYTPAFRHNISTEYAAAAMFFATPLPLLMFDAGAAEILPLPPARRASPPDSQRLLPMRLPAEPPRIRYCCFGVAMRRFRHERAIRCHCYDLRLLYATL